MGYCYPVCPSACPPTVLVLPPYAPTPPAAPLYGPIIGVTDGQSAAQGQVGEFVWGSTVTAWNLAAGVALHQTVATLTFQAGDWSVQARLEVQFAFNGATFISSPNPAGLNPAIAASSFGTPGGSITDVSLTSNTSQLLISGPTTLSFDVAVLANAAVTGNTYMYVTGRRMR